MPARGTEVSPLGDDSEGVREHGRSLEVRRAEEEVSTLARKLVVEVFDPSGTALRKNAGDDGDT